VYPCIYYFYLFVRFLFYKTLSNLMMYFELLFKVISKNKELLVLDKLFISLI